MKQRLSIGPSDFRQLREPGVLYVDKSDFITKVLEDSAQTLLLPRPRRFGKTTNVSTLRYFVEKTDEDRTALFADLAVWRSPATRVHFQRYPVIFLTFKDVKAQGWATCFEFLTGIIAQAYQDHRYLLQGALSPEESAVFSAILGRTASEVRCAEALRELARHLAAYHREKVVILIDEYDTPLHAAFAAGYYDQAVTFFRAFLSGGFKDNQHLFKGVLTGILRIAKESIFSGLNNLSVYNLLSPKFATEFGFTDSEVEYLAKGSGFTGPLDELRRWYNGYLFGGQVIYNPWSVLSFLASGTNTFCPYWVNTGSDDLIRELTGTYQAWISDSNGHNPLTRMKRSAGPYVLVSGALLANNWADLISGTLHHAINLTESGGTPPSSTSALGPNAVWADTREDGTLFSGGETCGDWTDTSGIVSSWGNWLSQNNWSLGGNGGNSAATACGSFSPLYCCEQ